MSNKTNEILEAIKQICKEKGLSAEAVINTVEQALAAAYRKDFGQKNQNIKVQFDPQSGKIKAFDVKIVVDYGPDNEDAERDEEEKDELRSESLNKTIKRDETDVAENSEDKEEKKFNPKFHLTIEEAKKIKKKAKVGDEIIIELEVPAPFGRMAAQTAKQVIVQRLREAERDALFAEYKEKEGAIVNGVVQRREGGNFLIDLGKCTAILPFREQTEREQYNYGQRIKVFIVSVTQSLRGPEIIVSRAHQGIVKELFLLEIPEIANKTVEIKSIAREAGLRSKVAVASKEANLDPVGACIGQRGARIQTIIAELGGEKIDIIEYSDDPKKFVSNALSPAKILKVEIDDKKKAANVEANEDQLSLAIGKGGQNVRLATQLTGWTIGIKGGGEEEKEKGGEIERVSTEEDKPKKEAKKKE